MRDPKTILITGGSSGLGEALALEYAASEVFLALSGRDKPRLEQVAEACRAKGATVETKVIDVTDAGKMASWIAATAKAHPLDLVIANAGISGGTGGSGEPPEQVRNIFRTNIDGVLNTVIPALDAMLAREHPSPDGKRGQIAIMSSLAGFRGLPGAPAYSASKAAVRSYGEALRGEFHHRDVEVNVICPGYVRTPLTAPNKFRMPFLMDADRAARIMRRGLGRNRGRIAFPRRLYFLIWLMGVLPAALVDRALRRLPKKD